MAEVIRFGLKKEESLLLARKAFDNGDVARSVSILKDVIKQHGRFFEASIALSQVYSSIRAYNQANLVLFEALSKNPTGEDRDSINLLLAQNFFSEGKLDAVGYYLKDIAEQLNIDPISIEEREVEDEGSRFRIVYPKSDSYYQGIIDKAYKLLHERKFDEAILLLDEVDEKSPLKRNADHIALVCFMMKEDVDGVIVNAKRVLERDKDNLSAKCTLATAYLVQDKQEEANRIVEDILSSEYSSGEDMLMVLHLLVNMEMHSKVIVYAKKLLNELDYQPQVMIWLSQALYNIGQKDEARKLMHKVDVIFGDKTPASYMLKLYNENVDSVSYTMGMAVAKIVSQRKQIKAFLSADSEELTRVIESDDEKGESLRKLLRDIYGDEEEGIKIAITKKLFTIKSKVVEDIAREALYKTPSLSFELLSGLVCFLVDADKETTSFCVVAQDLFKDVYIEHPVALKVMPLVMQSAYMYCLSDIIYTDEEHNLYIARLKKVIDSLIYIDEKGRCKFHDIKRSGIAKLKSVQTMIAVLLCKVYEDEEDMMNEILVKYDVKPRLFDKYFKMFFGE